jgi:hypothetical protein
MPASGFVQSGLNSERSLLQSAGWTYKGGYGGRQGQMFTYDSRVIPGVKGSDSTSEKNVDVDHQSRPADGPICCSLLIPQFPAMSPAPAKCKCVVKPSHRWGAETRSSEGHDLFELQRYQLHG